MSDVEGMVLSICEFFPAGGTSVRRWQSISQTLAAEHVTTFSGDNQSATVDYLWREQTSG